MNLCNVGITHDNKPWTNTSAPLEILDQVYFLANKILQKFPLSEVGFELLTALANAAYNVRVFLLGANMEIIDQFITMTQAFAELFPKFAASNLQGLDSVKSSSTFDTDKRHCAGRTASQKVCQPQQKSNQASAILNSINTRPVKGNNYLVEHDSLRSKSFSDRIGETTISRQGCMIDRIS